MSIFSGIGEDFINQLAEKENLIIERNTKSQGLIPSMDMLNLSGMELSNLSQQVIGFYENTAKYNLDFTVKWNPFFKLFGVLVNKLFSNRINQLNIPTKNIKNTESIKSEIITLFDPTSNQVKYTIWLRTIKSNSQIIYSGVYGVCKLPSGKTCIKAVFPLPKGNATVIMSPSVGINGELILESSGKKFGDAGFYFLLNDSKGNYWSQFINSFHDRLIIGTENEYITAEQTLTLWRQRVLKFNYKIELKNKLNHYAHL
ncbi:hypothetical protein LZQ00_11670 [Sphingobacterium sp. SRCM116780]|uniref:hypothetical protein n=1 Tax=Sphingobacterium sp. SRCM116780 TaxID=2907623 RepID=UPI001F2879E3|nr:hypothetical protein [Sphingobacterium sp. SRCM116780]UIR54937.1 hypothetical protein LZQ00_11670 [Sphingobacterium sp. SRCM116780]